MRLIAKGKIEKIASDLFRNGLDAAVFINSEPVLDPNIPYLSGMHGMFEGALIMDEKGMKLIVTDLDHNRAETEAEGCEIVRMDKKVGLFKTVKKELKGFRKIGVSKRMLTLKMAEDLRLKSRTEDIGIVLAEHRSVKEERELDAVRESARITNSGIRFISEILKEGFTETELVSRLESELKSRGSEKPAFGTILASGKRSALIHPYPGATGRKIGKGPAILDFGCVCRGYHTDVTVPFFIGRTSPETERIYETVSKIWKQLMGSLKAGVKVSSLHETYRKALESRGYDMRHSLGHGIGLDIHEYPSLSSENAVLKAGMTIAVEPGVYVDSIGGCRLENDIIVKKNGCEVITKSKLIRM